MQHWTDIATAQKNMDLPRGLSNNNIVIAKFPAS